MLTVAQTILDEYHSNHSDAKITNCNIFKLLNSFSYRISLNFTQLTVLLAWFWEGILDLRWPFIKALFRNEPFYRAYRIGWRGPLYDFFPAANLWL